MPEKTLVVKIDKSLNQGKSIHDAAAGNWKISLSKAKNVTTLVAVKNQHVVDVFSVSNPFIIKSGSDNGRVQFGSITSLPKSARKPYESMEPFTFCAACKYI